MDQVGGREGRPCGQDEGTHDRTDVDKCPRLGDGEMAYGHTDEGRTDR